MSQLVKSVEPLNDTHLRFTRVSSNYGGDYSNDAHKSPAWLMPVGITAAACIVALAIFLQG